MDTESVDYKHTQQRIDQNGRIVTIEIEAAEAAEADPMPKWPWEQEASEE